MIGMVAEGQKLKFDAINAAGGVKMGDGKTRQVELVIMDDANEPPRTVTNARRMAEQTKVFAFVGSVGTPQNQAIKAYTAQNKIPNIFIYSGIYEWGDEKQNPWGIGMVPSFTTEAAIYAKYLQEHKPDAKVAHALSQHRLRHRTSSKASRPPSRTPRCSSSPRSRTPIPIRPSIRSSPT